MNYLRNAKIATENYFSYFKSIGLRFTEIKQSPFSNSVYISFECQNKQEYSIRISDHKTANCSYTHIYSIKSLSGDFLINNMMKIEIERNILSKQISLKEGGIGYVWLYENYIDNPKGSVQLNRFF